MIGAKGTEFFIILKGEVSVYKREKKQTEITNRKETATMDYASFRKALEGELLETMAKSMNLSFYGSNNGGDSPAKGEVNSPRYSPSPKSSIFRKKKRNFGSVMKEIDEQPDDDPKKIFIKNLQSGASFGELALLENRPRAATIACKTDCVFAVLEKTHFNTILSI